MTETERMVNVAIEIMKRQIPKQIETEGGRSWWYTVCPECHGAVDSKDHFCRHCGQALTE